jgi:hypothetical protein
MAKATASGGVAISSLLRILTKRRSATDRRKESYSLTGKGLALIPALAELANWGVSYAPDVAANPFWVSKAQTDRGRVVPAHPRHRPGWRLGVPRGEQRDRPARAGGGTCETGPFHPDPGSAVLSHCPRFRLLLQHDADSAGARS